MIKIVTLFLIAIAVLAMIGRLKWPGGARLGRRDGNTLSRPRRCKSCGAYIIGSGPCSCGKG